MGAACGISAEKMLLKNTTILGFVRLS